MTQNKDIELPPLPDYGQGKLHVFCTGYAGDVLTVEAADARARQAIAQDRQQRHLKEKAQLEAEWCMVKNLQINHPQHGTLKVGDVLCVFRSRVEEEK